MVRRFLALFIALFLIGAGSSYATTVNYSTSNLGGSVWEYQYSVVNDSLAPPIEGFTIYFDYGLYSGLSLPSPKGGWDEITLDPDLVLGAPVPGYYDALAVSGGIAPGASESGFAVDFTWLGQGTPGSQHFEVYNPDPFDLLGSGNTTPTDAVPEPAVLLLLASGCPALIILRRKLLI